MAEIVKFILGRAGSGKSKKINEIILNEINLGSEKLIVIVPEQFSFEKEKSMLEFLGNNKFSNVKVMSFSRLCDFIPGVLNIPAVKPSSDTAQILMISEAIESLKSDLKMYAKGSADMKVAELVLKTIKELKSNKIDKEALQKIHDLCAAFSFGEKPCPGATESPRKTSGSGCDSGSSSWKNSGSTGV